MKTLLISACATFVLSNPVQASTAGSALYGKELTLSQTVKLATVTAEFGSYEDKDILLEGRIKDVCQKKGCWMVFEDGGSRDIRVTFAGYGFFLPKDVKNKKTRVQGKLKEKTISVKEARHYAEDAGASPEEIAKITEPQKNFVMVATGVEVLE
jgi:hypothetical protein